MILICPQPVPVYWLACHHIVSTLLITFFFRAEKQNLFALENFCEKQEHLFIKGKHFDNRFAQSERGGIKSDTMYIVYFIGDCGGGGEISSSKYNSAFNSILPLALQSEKKERKI